MQLVAFTCVADVSPVAPAPRVSRQSATGSLRRRCSPVAPAVEGQSATPGCGPEPRPRAVGTVRSARTLSARRVGAARVARGSAALEAPRVLAGHPLVVTLALSPVVGAGGAVPCYAGSDRATHYSYFRDEGESGLAGASQPLGRLGLPSCGRVVSATSVIR